MSNVQDYLTKQLFVERNVVTYRLLSRVLNIHVNQAKNELAAFLESAGPNEQPFATYMLSGEELNETDHHLQPRSTVDDDTIMEVDSQQPLSRATSQEITPWKTIVLVPQHDLEVAMGRFSRITTQHIYSLSPSPLHDAGLISSVSDLIRQADARLSAEASRSLGRIIGSDVIVEKITPIASKSEPNPHIARPGLKPRVATQEKGLSKAGSKFKSTESVGEPSKEHAEIRPSQASKLTGQLSWAKAKPGPSRESSKETVGDVQDEELKQTLKDTPATRLARGTSGSSLQEEQGKRGTKRKPDTHEPSSDVESKVKPLTRTATSTSKSGSLATAEGSDGTPSPVATKKKGKKVILSDGEDEQKDGPARERKARFTSQKEESDIPKSLKAMFDLDDDQVIPGSSRPTEVRSSQEPESVKSEVEMEEVDPAPKKQPKKKKEKKVAPVGRNGLKKKRVVKQKTFMDGGYIVTEDYSSYESTDVDDVQPTLKTKGQTEGAKSAKVSLKQPRKATKSLDSVTTKKAGTKLSGRGSIQDFFGKK